MKKKVETLNENRIQRTIFPGMKFLHRLQGSTETDTRTSFILIFKKIHNAQQRINYELFIYFVCENFDHYIFF